MPINLSDLRSVSYWRDGQEPQRFYIGFCLFFSAIQDWALGQKELRVHNLNWSATCSYYSLVHAGRLLTFLALGDFPTQRIAICANSSVPVMKEVPTMLDQAPMATRSTGSGSSAAQDLLEVLLHGR